MIDTAHVRKRIDRDVFDYQQLLHCLTDLSKPRDKIRRLLAKGDIVRIKKGLYAFGEFYQRDPICRELLANLIYGPSYISLDYALSYHGLIPERVDTVTSVTMGRSREFKTPFGAFTYRQLANHRYVEGAVLEQAGDNTFLIASAEKALADKVWTDKRFEGIRLSDYGPYLTDDLRMDPAQLVALDIARLADIARAYNSRKISLLLRHIRARREGHHE